MGTLFISPMQNGIAHDKPYTIRRPRKVFAMVRTMSS